MKTHPRAKLGPAARQELCELIEAGMTIPGAARDHGRPYVDGPAPAMDSGAYPGAAALRARLVGLPVHQELGPVDVDRIADAVAAAVAG